MNARDKILTTVRTNHPQGDFALPELPSFPFDDGGDRVGLFLRNLAAMGGQHHAGTLATLIAKSFSNAAHIISTVPEYSGTRQIDASTDPSTLADVDLAITRAAFGVAETGSVLLTDDVLRTNAVAYLAQHLIVLLDPTAIVLSLQDAYWRNEFHHHRYCSFHTGPSATADIEGVLIHGAQGVRSLTLVLDS